MAGLNLKQLLEKARQAMKDNSPSDCFLQLKESLRDDYYWEAMSVEIDYKSENMDNAEEVKTIGYGQTPEEALNELIEKLDPSYNKALSVNLWSDIMDKSYHQDNGLPAIEMPTLRKILEKYNILEQEKGM